MTAYILVEENVIDPEGFQKYRKSGVSTTIEHFGGKILASGGTIETLEGDWHPNRLVILEFESVEQAKRWYNSDEYAPLKNIRLTTTNSQAVLVQGI
jgi:uncharacterized protein (DUF1330 family)